MIILTIPKNNVWKYDSHKWLLWLFKTTTWSRSLEMRQTVVLTSRAEAYIRYLTNFSSGWNYVPWLISHLFPSRPLVHLHWPDISSQAIWLEPSGSHLHSRENKRLHFEGLSHLFSVLYLEYSHFWVREDYERSL